MTAMLRHLRLGDGALARFNGMGATERDALATVLAYDEGRASPARDAAVRSGYARLSAAESCVLLDAGAAPPLELAGAACAGCLSFEMSSGSELLLVNGGTPAPAEAARRAVARATASHNTLCLGEQSSAKLMRNARLERAIGSALLRHPDRVACEVRQSEAGGHRAGGLPRRLRRAPSASSTPARSSSMPPARGSTAATSSPPPRASYASLGTCRSPFISTSIPTRRPAWAPRRRRPSYCSTAASIGA